LKAFSPLPLSNTFLQILVANLLQWLMLLLMVVELMVAVLYIGEEEMEEYGEMKIIDDTKAGLMCFRKIHI
jgi:hypothetical protein